MPRCCACPDENVRTYSPRGIWRGAHGHPERKADIASAQESQALYLSLLTLLFSYAYDARTTQHDPTPESAWTIAVLTPAFTALDPPTSGGAGVDDLPSSSDIVESLVSSYRRALAFPLYRSWAIVEACRMDAARLLARGTRTVLRCLLELRAILDAHEVYYVYSRIWLDDFCRWVQTSARYSTERWLVREQNLYLFIIFSEDHLKRLGQDVSRLSMSKDSLGWDLVALEHAVQTAREGPSDSDDEEPDSERPALLQ